MQHNCWMLCSVESVVINTLLIYRKTKRRYSSTRHSVSLLVLYRKSIPASSSHSLPKSSQFACRGFPTRSQQPLLVNQGKQERQPCGLNSSFLGSFLINAVMNYESRAWEVHWGITASRNHSGGKLTMNGKRAGMSDS